MVVALIIIGILFYLGVEAGSSWPWSSKWQNKKRWFSIVPEIAIALILSGIASVGYSHLGMRDPDLFAITFLAAAISYAGIQSATWSFLQWDKKNQKHTPGRKYTLKPIVDGIADQWGFKLGDEGYSWISAAVKGTIITLPAGGMGGLFFAFGYEVGSHVGKYSNINRSIVSEGLSFAFVGGYYLIFLKLCFLF